MGRANSNIVKIGLLSKKPRCRFAAAVAPIFLFVAPVANAIPTLRLSAGTNTVVIADGSSLDGSAAPGVVTYIGGLGGFDSTFSITAGITKPATGSSSNPLMTLNEVTVIGGSGTLIIEFSENNFGPISASTLFASIGGTTNSTLNYSIFSDSSNDLFGMANLVTNQGPFSGNASSFNSFGGPLGGGDASGFLPASSSFSLTQRVIIARGSGPDNTGFNARLSAVPVPDGGATVALLGFSMVGLAGVMRILGGGVRQNRSGTPDQA